MLAAATLTTAVYSSAPVQAAETAPVSIGLVLAKQGNFGELGTEAERGVMLAAEQVNSKVLGRPIQVTWYDDPDPQTAQQNMAKLADSQHVVGIIAGNSSASALAETAVAKRIKIPTIIAVASAKDVTGAQCNRYTFRTYYPADVATRAFVPAMMEKGRKWYFLTPNYAAGHDAYAAMKTDLVARGGTEVANDLLPVGTTDFSSLILKIRQADPDVVAVSFSGADLTNFLKQYAQYKMPAHIAIGSPFFGESSFWAIDKDASTGRYTTLWLYADPSNPPDERLFAKTYQAKYGSPATLVAWEGWTSMRALLRAIEEAKSTDARAIVGRLESIKWTDRPTPSYYRVWDHQFIHPLSIVDAHPPKRNKWDTFNIVKAVPDPGVDPDSIFGAKAQSACAMDDF
ncbi:MAG: ABC transporter substrate-binding protein [Janthinobacterium lividum]